MCCIDRLRRQTNPDIADTQVLETVGSPLYMSPEQIREEPVTNQTDLFALGVVMYELLTGRHPFSADTLAALTHRILEEEPEPVEQLRPDTPESLRRIVERSMAKDRQDRYATALELAAELSQAFSDLNHPLDSITTENRVDLLKAIDFFQDFPDAEIWELLRRAAWEDYQEGDVIIRENEPGKTFYIIVSGEVTVLKGKHQVTRLSAGECFGEMAYLSQSERTATVIAVGDVATLKMNAASIDRATLRCQAEFHRRFIAALIGRLAETTARVSELGNP